MFPIPAIRRWSSRNALTGARRPGGEAGEPRGAERLDERLGPEPRREVGPQVALVEELPRAEATDVPVRDVRSGVQPKRRAPVRVVGQLSRRRMPERSRHAEVDDERAPALEPDEQVLAAPVDRRDLLADERVGDESRLDRPGQPRVEDLRAA